MGLLSFGSEDRVLSYLRYLSCCPLCSPFPHYSSNIFMAGSSYFISVLSIISLTIFWFLIILSHPALVLHCSLLYWVFACLFCSHLSLQLEYNFGEMDFIWIFKTLTGSSKRWMAESIKTTLVGLNPDSVICKILGKLILSECHL